MGLEWRKVSFWSKNYHKVKELYEAAFPAQERLPYLPLVLNSWRRLVNFYAYYDQEEFVGLAYTIANKELFTVLFLAVRDDLRSKGYGSLILQNLQAVANHRPLILTIEVMDETATNYEQRLQRLSFYERNGFQLTQSFYHEGHESYQIMTTDKTIKLAHFEKLMRQAFLGLIPVRVD